MKLAGAMGPRVTWGCLGGLSSPEELEELDQKFAYFSYFMPRMLNRSEISGRQSIVRSRK